MEARRGVSVVPLQSWQAEGPTAEAPLGIGLHGRPAPQARQVSLMAATGAEAVPTRTPCGATCANASEGAGSLPERVGRRPGRTHAVSQRKVRHLDGPCARPSTEARQALAGTGEHAALELLTRVGSRDSSPWSCSRGWARATRRRRARGLACVLLCVAPRGSGGGVRGSGSVAVARSGPRFLGGLAPPCRGDRGSGGKEGLRRMERASNLTRPGDGSAVSETLGRPR